MHLMLASDNSEVHLAVLSLMRDVIHMPYSTGSADGMVVALGNQALLGGDGLPAAMTRIIRRDIEMQHEPVFITSTVCLEAIALLLTGAWKSDFGKR